MIKLMKTKQLRELTEQELKQQLRDSMDVFRERLLATFKARNSLVKLSMIVSTRIRCPSERESSTKSML